MIAWTEISTPLNVYRPPLIQTEDTTNLQNKIEINRSLIIVSATLIYKVYLYKK